jgi:hypothetical protein
MNEMGVSVRMNEVGMNMGMSVRMNEVVVSIGTRAELSGSGYRNE